MFFYDEDRDRISSFLGGESELNMESTVLLRAVPQRPRGRTTDCES